MLYKCYENNPFKLKSEFNVFLCFFFAFWVQSVVGPRRLAERRKEFMKLFENMTGDKKQHELQTSYGPCSFSAIVFHENIIVVFLFDHMIIFPHFLESKKTRIEFLRRSVHFSARELRSETIPCIFG